MGKIVDYNEKFNSYENFTLFRKLAKSEQDFIKNISFIYKFTFQEFRQIVEANRDLAMWGEKNLESWWIEHHAHFSQSKQKLIKHLKNYLEELRTIEKSYPTNLSSHLINRETNKVISTSRNKKIFGMCPVASDKTVCCQLRTIDPVENCIFGCSYCTIQTFYTDNVFIEKEIKQKLREIHIDENRFYHFGTGQSSDSLAWGNRNNILEAHCEFAQQYPKILMEFKTKSNNIEYFLNHEIPKNVLCSWSLNPAVIIDNEEHFTAGFEERIKAARLLADKGIKVAFHFHPMIYYQGWTKDYPSIASTLINTFSTNEVLFVSFGSVTLIKPVINKIRDIGNPTKVLQMKFVKDPHGKYTYPDETKIKMFRHIYKAFSDWHDDVFMYLCMEKAFIWEETFGYVYKNNDEFEQDFGNRTMSKVNHI